MDAHINYWHIVGNHAGMHLGNDQPRDYLEVGVMLDDPSVVESVCIYIPQSVNRRELVDCSSHFENNRIAQGIFNEPLRVTLPPTGGPRYVELSVDQSIYCRVHRFLINDTGIHPSELEVTKRAGGTLLTIKAAALREASIQPSARAYFRLRVSMGSTANNALLSTISTADRFLQSGFEQVKYIDFRLNEARTLPDEIEKELRQSQQGDCIGIRLVAFLTAVPVRSQLAVSHPPFHKLRILEDETWNGYLPGIPRGMMVYHFKRDQPFKDWMAFVKLQTRRSDLGTLAVYVAIAFLFGVLGNCAAASLDNRPAARVPATVSQPSALSTGGPPAGGRSPRQGVGVNP